MAKTLRQVLSELVTDIKAVNLDDRVSFRYLDSKFKSKVEYFLRLEAKSREILKDFSIWKPINCIDLIDVASNACNVTDICFTLKRSKDKIPEAYNTNYGQLIKVLTIDGINEFKPIKSNEYGDYINREYIRNKYVYWMEDQYIYIPNTTIETIKSLIIPKNPIEVDKLNCEASACASPLDAVLSYPDYLITLAKKEVLNELLGAYKRVIEDEKGDDNTNVKN